MTNHEIFDPQDSAPHQELVVPKRRDDPTTSG